MHDENRHRRRRSQPHTGIGQVFISKLCFTGLIKVTGCGGPGRGAGPGSARFAARSSSRIWRLEFPFSYQGSEDLNAFLSVHSSYG